MIEYLDNMIDTLKESCEFDDCEGFEERCDTIKNNMMNAIEDLPQLKEFEEGSEPDLFAIYIWCTAFFPDDPPMQYLAFALLTKPRRVWKFE